MKHIGDFKIESGRVYVSDPCYKTGTWCQALVDGVKNGNWEAHIDNRDEGRPGLLRVNHESYPDITHLECSIIPNEIGVDSGQAGVFDAAHYRQDSSIPEDFQPLDPGGMFDDFTDEEGGRFYGACCDRTLGPTGEGRRDDNFHGGGTIPFGAVSSSGYGDGGYEAKAYKNDDGEIVAIEIEFIPEEEDEPCEFCGENDCCGDCQDEEAAIEPEDDMDEDDDDDGDEDDLDDAEANLDKIFRNGE